MRKGVLVVAYYFPPIAGIGMQRTRKFVTYLPRWGWEPTVLTARNPGVRHRDHDIEAALPADLRIERALSPEPETIQRKVGPIAKRLLARIHKVAEGDAAQSAGGTSGAHAYPARYVPGTMTASRLWRGALSTMLFPDEQIGWVPFAVRRGIEAVASRPMDAIYSSSGPISGHLIAALIARETGLPWVADFRDPWIGSTYINPPPRAYRGLQARIERRIVERADRLVFATPGLARMYEERYPWAAGRIRTIQNGYDRNDFPAPAAVPAPTPAAGAAPGNAKFKLTYAGSVYGDRELSIFLDGLELLLDRRPNLRDCLEVEFVGSLNLHNQSVAARYATPERLGSVVRFAGLVSHAQALEHAAQADALLQLIADGPNRSHIVGGKLVEYVGMDRQILAIIPEGDARDLLRDLDWGIVADPSPAGVAEGLERLLATPRPNRAADPQGLYDRINLTGKLADVLDELA